jgi:hypothetical protein
MLQQVIIKKKELILKQKIYMPQVRRHFFL